MDCPVCKNAQVEEGATQCPECSSDLSSFTFINQITKQRGGLRKASLILSIVALLAFGGWAATYVKLSDSGSGEAPAAKKTQAPIADNDQQASDLTSKVEEQNGVIEELNTELEKLLATLDGGNYKVHIVQKGETLWGIAEKYLSDGHKLRDIADRNEIEEPNFIQVGDTIIIKH